MKIAIIPARGGSKRILKKNIKNFMGKPIISYSIASAIKCNLFDKVIVSVTVLNFDKFPYSSVASRNVRYGDKGI